MIFGKNVLSKIWESSHIDEAYLRLTSQKRINQPERKIIRSLLLLKIFLCLAARYLDGGGVCL